MEHPDALPLAELCDTLIQTRRHIGPRRLEAPGPDAATLRALFACAAAAPDHERLRPWRFLVLGPSARERLAQCFAAALRERDPQAEPAQLEQAREKAFRAPVLLLAIADLRAEQPDVPPPERLVSLGCAIQNLLLAAHARGFASGLSSGRALQSQVLREAFGLQAGELALCFVSLGTATRVKPPQGRPSVDEFVQWVA
ncbi:MAG: nitroreductase [Burkholderiaceae bacterium]|nr:nitroreductase [Burkholderiaceae bacterium]